jgi:hypothetical protein
MTVDPLPGRPLADAGGLGRRRQRPALLDDRELAIGSVRVRVAEGIELLDAREVGRVEAASVRVDVDDGQDEHALGRCGGRTPGELGHGRSAGRDRLQHRPAVGFASIRSAANASS